MPKETKEKIIEILRKIDNQVPLGASWIYVEKIIKEALQQREKEILEELLKGIDKKEFEKDYKTGTMILAYNRAKNDLQKLIEQKLKDLNL